MENSTQDQFAKLLEIHFEGYFISRICTDPDPASDRRGTSGYTIALAYEDDLDQIIRLQQPPNWEKNIREPMERMNIHPGVKVRAVTYNGQPWAHGTKVLKDARVDLVGESSIFKGPTFQSRNNIVGSDDTMAFVIDPFDLRIVPEHSADSSRGPGSSKPGECTGIRAADFIDPADAERFLKRHGKDSTAALGPGDGCFETKEIWQIENPAVYGRRLPVSFDEESQEVKEILRVFDFYRYFRDRIRFLKDYIKVREERITRCTTDGRVSEPAGSHGPARLARLRGGPEGCDVEMLAAEIEGAKSRIFEIESWGERFLNKLGFKDSWAHSINGPRCMSKELMKHLGGEAGDPWRVRYWFGGWDGDLLVGYMRGTLSIPFKREVGPRE